jgi:hypothetical protein
MVPHQLLGPKGPDDEQPRRRQAHDQEREEGTRRGISPVEVLELQHERRIGGRSIEDVDQPLEDDRLGDRESRAVVREVAVARRELRQDPGKCRPVGPDHHVDRSRIERLEQSPEGLDHGRVGWARIADVKAPADGDCRATVACPLVPGRDKS